MRIFKKEKLYSGFRHCEERSDEAIPQFRQQGFTLMEMVVALGIFAIATTYSISIFVQSNQVQKRTANIERLTADARYVVEVMAREFRLGYLDYNYAGYTSPLSAGPQTELALINADNQPIRFKRTDTGNGRFAVQVCEGANCNLGVYDDLTPADLSVVTLSFYLSPGQDPFVWQILPAGYLANEQPRATIIMETVSLSPDLLVPKKLNFQTTVIARKYVR